MTTVDLDQTAVESFAARRRIPEASRTQQVTVEVGSRQDHPVHTVLEARP